MKRARPLTPAQFIAGLPVFRAAEVEAWYRETKRRPAAARRMLGWHVAQGRLQVVRRGVYAQRDPGLHDPFVVASCLTDDAVVAYDGALALHGVAGAPYRTTYLTARRTSVLRWNDCIFQPVREPIATRRIETVTILGREVRVTTLEQSLVDCLTRPDRAPEPAELAWAFPEARSRVEVALLIRLAVETSSPLVVSRLAFCLSCGGGAVTPAQEATLVRRGLQRPDYFHRAWRTKQDELVSRWNLIVPPALKALLGRAPPVPPSGLGW